MDEEDEADVVGEGGEDDMEADMEWVKDGRGLDYGWDWGEGMDVPDPDHEDDDDAPPPETTAQHERYLSHVHAKEQVKRDKNYKYSIRMYKVIRSFTSHFPPLWPVTNIRQCI
jgi:hypothetical protein